MAQQAAGEQTRPPKPQSRELVVFHAEICQALADPTRIAILYELADGPRNVSEIAAALGQPQPAVSRHLKTLRDRGMVKAERSGGYVVYSLADRRVVEALDLLRAVMARVLSDRRELVDELSHLAAR